VAVVVWHAVTAEAAAGLLGSDVHAGLSAREAAGRLARSGPNRITARKGRPAWLRFVLQFHAPLVYILLAAAAVTLLLGDYTDSAVIFAVVLVNAVIGHVQESRAAQAIDALARSMRVEATVERDAQRRRVDAADLVAGDLILLEPGDKVPADLRLLKVRDFRVDESTLTGESKSVAKRPDPLPDSTVLADRRNMAYAGTLVTRGTAEGIVVATADATEVGQISEMISSAAEVETPLTRKIASFSRLLLWLIVGVAGVTFAVGVARGNPAVEMFKAAVALAVGAIPEGLPAAVTIMLAVGVSRMARRRAVIRKLPAVEALGSTTVICSDKTGTLTQNQMTVQVAWVHPSPGGDARSGRRYKFTGAGYDPSGQILLGGAPADSADGGRLALDEMLACGALCSDASLLATDGRWAIQGDPTEAALVVAARKSGLTQEALAEQFPRVDAIPFESDRQYMATLHRRPGTAAGQATDGRVIYVKGSVERVSALCERAVGPAGEIVPLDAAAVHAAVAELAGAGLRVLAFARRDPEGAADDLTHPMVEHAPGGLTFLGVLGMIDPPRPEAVDAVASCQRAGIRVKMITGDHAVTAATIARMIGIDGAACGGGGTTPVLTGAEMAAIPDGELPDRAERTAVFARMTPEQKLRLVKALQGRGHVVAMTGDGVNDAPALRQADIGVAMGVAGTEVAKDAADVVLADDNFASIEAAVEEGRTVFANLSKFIVWTLPTGSGEGLLILAAILLGWPLPILPVQALYINMATAVLLGIPLVFEAREPGVMSRPPRNPREPLLTFELFMRTGFVSLLLCAGAMGLFHWESARGAGEAAARTAAASVIVIGEVFYLFSSRALLRPAWSVLPFSNPWLWGGIAVMLATQFAFAHVPVFSGLFHAAPLEAAAWARVFAVGALLLVAVELEKAIRRWVAKSNGPSAAERGTGRSPNGAAV
jgi:magnesium-transporting ATPase (P-type)